MVAAILLAALLVVPVVPWIPRGTPSSASPGLGWAEGLMAGTTARSVPLPSSQPISLTVSLRPSNASQLARLDATLADPASPEFDRFLTEPQFVSRFAPREENLSAVEHYFGAFGARGFRSTGDRLGLSFAIDASGAARAFGAELFLSTAADGGTTRTLDGTPTLPASVARMLSAVTGLTGPIAPAPGSASPGAKPLVEAPAAVPEFLNGTGPLVGTQWFVGSDYVGMYDEAPLLPGEPGARPNATFASSEAVATLLMSGYNASQDQNLPPWDPAAVYAYFNATFPTGWPHPALAAVPVPVSGIVPPAPGPNGNLTDDSKIQVENSLDLEMAGSLAPGAEVANFYFPASLQYATPGAVTDGEIADDFASELSDALSYNYSSRHLASVSASFGIADLNDSLWNTELEHAAALGVTVVASSGDSGNAPSSATKNYLGSGPSWPATATFNDTGTIAVGGTTLVSGGTASGGFDGSQAPDLAYDANPGPIRGASAWYDTLGGPGDLTGSQGGGSTLYPIPYWQFHSAAEPAVASAETLQTLPSLRRAEPDVAFSANETIAYTGTGPSGQLFYALLQGTSIGSPLFAGMVAEWAAYANHGFGFLDPALYRVAGYYSAHPGPGDPFLDVTSGRNYVFSAAAGWDAVTGWGGIDASAFVTAYANATIEGFEYSGPTPGLGAPTPPTSPIGYVLIAGIIVLLLGVVVIVFATRRRPDLPRLAPVPAGLTPEGPSDRGTLSGATFECRFCGSPRQDEPVRCPKCGKL